MIRDSQSLAYDGSRANPIREPNFAIEFRLARISLHHVLRMVVLTLSRRIHALVRRQIFQFLVAYSIRSRAVTKNS